MTRTNEKRPGRFRIGMAGATMVVIGAAGALGGCSEVPDYLNPVEWYNSTVDYVAGDDKGDVADARTQAAAKRGEGADQPMPSLGDTPDRPNVDAAKTSREIREGLVADTTGRKYAPVIQHQGAAQSVLADEQRPTVVAASPAAPEAPKPVAATTSPAAAPAKPMPAMPAPMTAGNPPAPPTITQDVKAPSAAMTKPAAQPAMPQFAPPAPPANAMMGAADSFETVVISSDGVHRTTSWGEGAKAAPAAVAMAPRAPIGGQYTPPGQTLKVATIQFRDGSAGLDDRDTAILRQVLQLQKERGGRIRIVGHASSRTRDMDPTRHRMVNYQISVDRAESVAKEFQAMGVPNQDLVVVAKADTEPLYYEIMPSGEAGNRRTDIYLDY